MAYYDSMQRRPMSKQDHMKKDAKEWKRDEGSDYSKRGKKDGYAPKDTSYASKSKRPFDSRFDRTDKPSEGARSYGHSDRTVRPGKRPEREGAPKRFRDDRPAKPESRPVRPAPRPERPAPRPAPHESFDLRPQEPENLLSGRNPIREAIRAGRDIEKLLVAKGELNATAREIVMMAKENHIPVQIVERSRLDEITHNHQGMIAFASAYRYYDVEDMLADAAEKGEKPFLVILDSVTDPQNLGAIIRTAACVGAHGVIVPQRRAVGLTPSAVKASAGAIEKIKVARVTNLARTIDQLKAQGIWMYGADMRGENFRKVDFSGAVALIVGSEGDGISRLTLEKCDHIVSLPMTGAVDSLNASVAAGVLMYAIQAAR